MGTGLGHGMDRVGSWALASSIQAPVKGK
jgi:hypothetical protein